MKQKDAHVLGNHNLRLAQILTQRRHSINVDQIELIIKAFHNLCYPGWTIY